MPNVGAVQRQRPLALAFQVQASWVPTLSGILSLNFLAGRGAAKGTSKLPKRRACTRHSTITPPTTEERSAGGDSFLEYRSESFFPSFLRAVA